MSDPILAAASSRVWILTALLLCGTAPVSDADAPAMIHFTIDADKNVKPISPFIYGANEKLEGPLSHLGLRRVGGNRWTAYNWVNNAFTLQHSRAFTRAVPYQLTSKTPEPVASEPIHITTPGHFRYTMPPMSVTTLRLTTAP